MILIIGPAFSGKSKYARELLSALDAEDSSETKEVIITRADDFFDGRKSVAGKESVLSGVKKDLERRGRILSEVQDLIAKDTDDSEIESLADTLCESAEILTASETGAGIVPVDPTERRVRELQGRLLQELSRRADRVVRVFYGIEEVLK